VGTGPAQKALMEMGELMAYQHPGFWSCCDHLADKRRLEDMWSAGSRPWATWLTGETVDRKTERRRWQSDTPGIGRGGHPGDWVRYRSI
jgi:glucose-1-phosphate cytidylyltransferase